MPDIRMREKHQVTLPASVVREAKLMPDDRLAVTFVNGSIILTPKRPALAKSDVMAFAGVGRGLWGETAREVDETLSAGKDAWER